MPWLDANKIPRTGVKFAELKFGEMGPALQRGTVGAALIPEPAKTDAINAGQVRNLADTFVAVSPEFATIVWFTTKDWLEKNPPTRPKKLLAGIYATRPLDEHAHSRVGDILAKVSKMDPAVVAGMGRMYFATTNDKKITSSRRSPWQRATACSRAPVTIQEFSTP